MLLVQPIILESWVTNQFGVVWIDDTMVCQMTKKWWFLLTLPPCSSNQIANKQDASGRLPERCCPIVITDKQSAKLLGQNPATITNERYSRLPDNHVPAITMKQSIAPLGQHPTAIITLRSTVPLGRHPTAVTTVRSIAPLGRHPHAMATAQSASPPITTMDGNGFYTYLDIQGTIVTCTLCWLSETVPGVSTEMLLEGLSYLL